jgi:hypothetical protein
MPDDHIGKTPRRVSRSSTCCTVHNRQPLPHRSPDASCDLSLAVIKTARFRNLLDWSQGKKTSVTLLSVCTFTKCWER